MASPYVLRSFRAQRWISPKQADVFDTGSAPRHRLCQSSKRLAPRAFGHFVPSTSVARLPLSDVDPEAGWHPHTIRSHSEADLGRPMRPDQREEVLPRVNLFEGGGGNSEGRCFSASSAPVIEETLWLQAPSVRRGSGAEASRRESASRPSAVCRPPSSRSLLPLHKPGARRRVI